MMLSGGSFARRQARLDAAAPRARFRRRTPLALLLLAATAVLGGASSARAAVRLDPLQKDAGTFRVYFRDRLLGTEKFSLEPRGDSVIVFSNVDQILPSSSGDQRLDKKIIMVVKALDYDLLSYSSEQDFLGRRLLRGLSLHDTTFTAYRESEQAGGGETFARPPGRLFVIDSQVFALFDILLRSLHGKMLGERMLPVVILGEPRDSVMEIVLRPGPAETIQLNGKPRLTRRVLLSDGTSEFIAWVSARGAMLRLEQPATGLRVERTDAASGARAAPAPKPGPSANRTPPANPPTSPAKPKTPPGR